MNQKLKQVGLFAILAVFSMSLTTSFVGDAEASSSKDSKFRALTEEIKIDSSPSLKLVFINDPATRPGMDFVVSEKITTFNVVYAVVNPTNADLRNVEILVTSDIESVNAELRGSHDGDRSIISFQIDAVDPASVSAQITGYEI